MVVWIWGLGVCFPDRMHNLFRDHHRLFNLGLSIFDKQVPKAMLVVGKPKFGILEAILGASGGHLADLRGYVGGCWCGKPKNIKFVSVYARFPAGLGCHFEDLRITAFDLGRRFADLVLGFTLVDSLGVIEVSLCQDRRSHWEVQFV